MFVFCCESNIYFNISRKNYAILLPKYNKLYSLLYYWRITDDIYFIKYNESDDSGSERTKFS